MHGYALAIFFTMLLILIKVHAPTVFFITLFIFLFKIVTNLLMFLSVVDTLFKPKDQSSESVSFPLFGIEFIIVPVLVCSAYVAGFEKWWLHPLALLIISLAIALFSNLLIFGPSLVYMLYKKIITTSKK